MKPYSSLSVLMLLSDRVLCPTPKHASCTTCAPPLAYSPSLSSSVAHASVFLSSFFSGCNVFIPVFDPTYDTYDGLMERTPWTFDALLAVAAKIRSGTGPLIPAFYKCLEEAQGIARSSLFGPVVRKEAVQGMLLLAAWSTNGWLPSGHAMRMALDLGLHRALEKLADDGGKKRSEEEERNLGASPLLSLYTRAPLIICAPVSAVVSARIWLCLYWFDHQMSLGTGRPIVLRDESSIKHCRLLLSHPMASPTDVRLVSQVELIMQKSACAPWRDFHLSRPADGFNSTNLRDVVTAKWPGESQHAVLHSPRKYRPRQVVGRLRRTAP